MDALCRLSYQGVAARSDGRGITWFASAEDKASFMMIGTAAAESFGVPFTVTDEGPRYVVLRVG